MTEVRITHVGGPTTLIEVAGRRLLTDPTFDPPGRRYGFGWGTSSRKVSGPALDVDELPDRRRVTHPRPPCRQPGHGGARPAAQGRRRPHDALGGTPAGRQRARAHPVDDVAPELPGLPTIQVTATPARHGPPLSHPIVGDVTGFALRWEGQRHGALWISGDTVLYPGVREVARRLDVGTVLLHLGGVGFPLSGPVRYTLTAPRAVELCRALRPHTVLPVHYEGWSHFREGRSVVEAELAKPASGDLGERFCWLTPGSATDVSV